MGEGERGERREGGGVVPLDLVVCRSTPCHCVAALSCIPPRWNEDFMPGTSPSAACARLNKPRALSTAPSDDQTLTRPLRGSLTTPLGE